VQRVSTILCGKLGIRLTNPDYYLAKKDFPSRLSWKLLEVGPGGKGLKKPFHSTITFLIWSFSPGYLGPGWVKKFPEVSFILCPINFFFPTFLSFEGL